MFRRVAAAAAVVAGVVPAAAPSAQWAGAAPGDDTLFARQWALEQIGAPAAWPVARGGGVVIGVVDTGVDVGHPDLAGKVAATADCVGRPCAQGGGQDANGHGTLVSGIAAAATGNGRGIAAVAPDASVVVAKALSADGEGRVEDINAGIRWVVDQGARVVNLSLGDPAFLLTSVVGTPLRSGIEYAWSRGAVPVLASGNYNTGVADLGSQNYGALNAVVVGATDRTGAVAPYSSGIGNAKWGVVAPGGSGAKGADNNVISTYLGGGYASSAGTSMATPHVSAALAVLLSQGLSPTAAVQRLLATLDRIPCGSGCQGRLNLAAAVGPAPAPVERAPVETAPVETMSSPTSRRPATVTSTSTTSTLPPTSTSAPPPTAAPVPTVLPEPSELAARRGAPLADVEGGERNPLPVAAAVALLVVVGAATGTVGMRTGFRGAGGW
jgi:subtilisin family serine protease